MALLPEHRILLDEMIGLYGLESAWKSFLRERVRNSGKSFRYILKSRALAGTARAPSDLLAGLSVGEVSVLYEYGLAYSDRRKRKQDGQYFTPDDVARFLAGHAKRFPGDTVWIDPCSGVGNLSYWLAKRAKNPEDFVQKRLYLVDLDPLALLTARVLFTLAFQKKRRDLFNKLESRFLQKDFLSAGDLPAVDAAILNPPYVSGVLDERFETSSARNLYAYFIERVASLCRTGYISITPQTFTNGDSFHTLREVIIRGHTSLDVYCFDNVPDNIFCGIKYGSGNTNRANSTRAGVIIARKSKKQSHRITPLLRWRSHQRQQMLDTAHMFLSEVAFSSNIFPKVNRELKDLYSEITKSRMRLADYVETRPTQYALQIPTTPRYFISANKRPVQRTSFKVLYFRTPKDRDRAYVLLNSSYMYWWWRVNDGGMTISERTLLDLPIPPTSVSDEKIHSLAKKIEASENTSLVVKRNAGKIIENIKHSMDLVAHLTTALFPSYAQFLAETHSNTHVAPPDPEQEAHSLKFA